ncbi:MAG: hypothetical protein ACT452_19385 [Microthrixaceae bacterium]
MTPPAFPEFDESKLAMVTVDFVSGTPAMTFWCSQMELLPDVVRLDADLDGTVRPVVEIRRQGIRQLVVDFTAKPADY